MRRETGMGSRDNTGGDAHGQLRQSLRPLGSLGGQYRWRRAWSGKPLPATCYSRGDWPEEHCSKRGERQNEPWKSQDKIRKSNGKRTCYEE